MSCAFLGNLFCSKEASSIRLYSLGTAQHIKYSTIVFEQYISRPEQLSGYRGRKAHAEIFLDCHPSVSYEAGLACLHSHRKNAALFWQLQADNCNSDTNHMKSVPGSFLSQRERERETKRGRELWMGYSHGRQPVVSTVMDGRMYVCIFGTDFFFSLPPSLA